ncbi:MAG: lipid-A-disaccharide synthase-related protein [Cyanobacteriota bacterium]|nr:lipid-A-disaccharide synthase-related protein [Cyanobacteriota bacterium]
MLLLSNGHGEDLSGSLLARALQARGVAVAALPLVGHGGPYRQAGIAVLGRTRSYSTGGLGYTSWRGQLTELLQGQPLYLLRRLGLLLLLRRRFALVVAVGDLLPVLGGWLSGRPVAVYLVAYSSHYEGRLRLPWPCGWLLRRRRVRAVWSRDALTAADLSQQLLRPVRFLGNPFLDPVAQQERSIAAATPRATPCSVAPAAGPQRLALLPGSRLPEAGRNLELMLRLLALLPQALRQGGRLQPAVALVRELGADAITALAGPLGWRPEDPAVLVGHGLRLELGWGRFAEILGRADLVLSMAGTATEQAVGLAKPVLQLAGRGPQFTEGFAEAQRRLLGPGLFCATAGGSAAGGAGGGAGTGTAAALEAGAALAARLLEDLADPDRAQALQSQLDREARLRIGAPGGSERMAEAIMALLAAPSHG